MDKVFEELSREFSSLDPAVVYHVVISCDGSREMSFDTLLEMVADGEPEGPVGDEPDMGIEWLAPRQQRSQRAGGLSVVLGNDATASRWKEGWPLVRHLWAGRLHTK
mmetsp:Transcript_473/g.902  ORF Transcript_473/g.902 Transcript_473/m.902 type:complete len:107 (+) Transcript_473:64-384(+)